MIAVSIASKKPSIVLRIEVSASIYLLGAGDGVGWVGGGFGVVALFDHYGAAGCQGRNGAHGRQGRCNNRPHCAYGHRKLDHGRAVLALDANLAGVAGSNEL